MFVPTDSAPQAKSHYVYHVPPQQNWPPAGGSPALQAIGAGFLNAAGAELFYYWF